MKFSDRQIILFSILTGVASTIVRGYAVGVGNDVENLPQVLRAIDGNYLPNDFLVNASSGFGPRYFYVNFLAFLSSFTSIFFVYLILTLAANVLVSLISAFLAKAIFKNSLAALISAILVMAADGIQIGHASFITTGVLEPHLVAIVPALFSILLFYKKKPALAIFFSGVSSLLHPQVGLLTGLIILGALFALFLLKEVNISSFLSSVLIYLIFLSIWVIPTGQSQVMSTKEFIEIWVYFRNPHHLAPSTWAFRQFIEFFGFLVAAVVAWRLWQKSKKLDKYQKLLTPLIFLMILALFVFGYVFVEIIPTRLAASMQTFRLAYLLKWLGFVMFSGVIARTFGKIDFYFLFASVLAPITTVVGFISQLFQNKKNYFFILILPLLVIFRPQNKSIFLFLVLSLMAFIFMYKVNSFFKFLFVILIFFALVTYFKPILTLYNLEGEEPEMARYASDHTPPDSVFLTPSQFGQFRLVAQRAIVVDFKSLPLTDSGISQWYERITDLYGNNPSKFEDNYKSISEKKVSEVIKKYGVSYAVFYKDTEVGYPVLFETTNYKLVELGGVVFP